jgi:hypothetical protein
MRHEPYNTCKKYNKLNNNLSGVRNSIVLIVIILLEIISGLN